MSVSTPCKHYENIWQGWRLVDDVCAGERAVKYRRELYLPKPAPNDKSPENEHRYNSYLHRAMFYGATGQTLNGLIGAAFRIDPNFKADLIDYVEEDIDGSGVSIFQQAQSVLAQLLKKGRCGLLVDYPKTDTAVSILDQQTQAIRPNITLYDAIDIINWQVERFGSRYLTTMIVLKEKFSEQSEGSQFITDEIDQYRVLKLVNGVYTVEIHRDGIITETREPLDASGKTWEFIPFQILGSEANTWNINPIPLEPLARVNLAHYRNSADHEDSVFLCGQPQAYMTGLSEEWRDDLDKRGVYIGSRVLLPLPVGGTFGFAQAAPNTLTREALADKEEQMKALGALLMVVGKAAAKTATQSNNEQAVQHSVLTLCVANLNEAYMTCIGWMLRFITSTPPTDYIFEVKQNFVQAAPDAQMLTALQGMNQAGIIPKSVVWDYQRKTGLISSNVTDEELMGEIDGEIVNNGLA